MKRDLRKAEEEENAEKRLANGGNDVCNHGRRQAGMVASGVETIRIHRHVETGTNETYYKSSRASE